MKNSGAVTYTLTHNTHKIPFRRYRFTHTIMCTHTELASRDNTANATKSCSTVFCSGNRRGRGGSMRRPTARTQSRAQEQGRPCMLTQHQQRAEVLGPHTRTYRLHHTQTPLQCQHTHTHTYHCLQSRSSCHRQSTLAFVCISCTFPQSHDFP